MLPYTWGCYTFQLSLLPFKVKQGEIKSMLVVCMCESLCVCLYECHPGMGIDHVDAFSLIQRKYPMTTISLCRKINVARMTVRNSFKRHYHYGDLSTSSNLSLGGIILQEGTKIDQTKFLFWLLLTSDVWNACRDDCPWWACIPGTDKFSCLIATGSRSF